LVNEGEEKWARGLVASRRQRGVPLPLVEYGSSGGSSGGGGCGDGSEGKRARGSSVVELMRKVGEMESGVRRLIVSFV